jgi:hypothetical protein
MVSKRRRGKRAGGVKAASAQSTTIVAAYDFGTSRDGATAEYRQHHRVVSRASGVGGQRRCSRLEQLWDSDYVTPEAFYAGWRFGRDYEIGIIGEGGSCLSFRVSGGGDGHPSMARLDATRRFVLASAYLDAQKGLSRPGGSKVSEYLLRFIARDQSIDEMRAAMGYKDWMAARAWIKRTLDALTDHYKEADREAGRSDMPHTREAALRFIEPDDRRLPPRG